LASKTKRNLKALMRRLFEKAMLWELIGLERNPMEMVEIRGGSRRRRKPRLLTREQFHAISDALPEPYKTMTWVAICLGLRVSEVLALKWRDFDFQQCLVKVSRGVVHGRIGDVKSEYSADDLPLDSFLIELLLVWRKECPVTKGDWLFPNPETLQPFHASPIQQDYIGVAASAIGLTGVGWHTLRHAYRSLLDEGGAPVGIQQKLMRHANVATTMDVYGDAHMDGKRAANSNVVQMIRPSAGNATANTAALA
jgi:integrase